MRRELGAVVAVLALGACGGQTITVVGSDGGSSSSSGGSSGSSSGGSSSSSGGSSSSSGGSSSSSGGSSSSSGGSSSSSGSSSGGSSSSSGSSSGGTGRVPLNHRPDDSACGQPAAAGDCPGGGGPPGNCDADQQCTSGSDGRCIQQTGGIPTGCVCTYDACANDSACQTGQTCACHGSPYTYGNGNSCVPGDCRVDGDCGGGGGYCSPSYNVMSCGALAGYYCHTPQDTCIDDTDCGSSQGPSVCSYSTATGSWQCHMQGLCGL